MAQVLVKVETPVGFEDSVRLAAQGERAMLRIAVKAAQAAAVAEVADDTSLTGFDVGRGAVPVATPPQVTWNAAAGMDLSFTECEPATLFGSTRGVIELSGVAGGTSINFIGTYRPRGDTGIMADESAGRRLAHVAMEAMLTSLASQLAAAA